MQKIILFLVFFSAKIGFGQNLIEKANNCYKDKNYQCAIDAYKEAVEKNLHAQKDYAEIQFRIGYGYNELDKYPEAIQPLKNAITSNAGFSDAYWSLAWAYYSLKQYDEAIQNYSKTLQLVSEKEDQKFLYYWRGRSHFGKKQYKEAVADCKMAIQLDSSYTNAYAIAGDASYNDASYRDAARFYTKTIELGDDNKEVMANRYRWRGKSFAKLGEYDDAIKDYLKALELKPVSKETHWDLAAAFYNIKKYDDAISNYSKAIDGYKGDTTAQINQYYWRGRSYQNLKNHTKATADFDAALNLDPGYKDGWWQKAAVYYQQEKYKAAIPLYTKTINLAKDNSDLDDLYYYRGYCYIKTKDTVSAEADFKKALGINSKIAGANIEMGNIYFARKNYGSAVSYYYTGTSNGYTADSAVLSQIWFRKGYANLLQKYQYTASSDLENSIRYDSANKDAHRYLAEAYYYNSSFVQAEKEFEKCIRLYKNVKDSLHKMYSYRGIARSKQNKYKEALEDYEQALKLKPGDIEYIKGVGQLAFETKDYNKSVTNFTKLLPLYKPDQKKEIAFVYYARGRSYYELNNKEKAKADLIKAKEFDPDDTNIKQWLNYVTTGSN